LFLKTRRATNAPLHNLFAGAAMRQSDVPLNELNNNEPVAFNAAVFLREQDVATMVRTALQCAGMPFEEFSCAHSLLRSARRGDFRLVVLDADGADQSTLGLLDWRNNWLNPSTLLIGVGPADPAVACKALVMGVDDYLSKPLHGGELMARLTAATRRSQAGDDTWALGVAGCTLNRLTSTLCAGDHREVLTTRELCVMQLLLRNAGALITRQRLAAEVWGCDVDVASRTIGQHMYQLRRKLKRCAGDSVVIRSIYGSGYRLESTEPSDAVAASARLKVPTPSRTKAAPSLNTLSR
jgi:DNA-binding response OmpR family regulator